ncbi:molybdate metabolism regulator [Leptospira stimsonii]|uniref:Molybdate metabolism regulator n=1 Tax=Leptospira stimsonii TaxID=2202203 RepID=A0A396YW41_9LEPT|nr:molybdate metabolism regulator [Leptospira stimsonii]RHX85594.1 molybdate metabolism regulator [Leptospira stimsonii]
MIQDYLLKDENGALLFWQSEIYEKNLVITEGRFGIERRVEMKAYFDEKEVFQNLESLRNDKFKEGFTRASQLDPNMENEILIKIEKESDFHIQLEIAESLLSNVSDSNRKKLLKSLVRDCDCVLMGLGTADGEDYDGEDEYYPQMIQEETGLTPESSRNIYKKKFFAYENLLESE